MPTRGVATGVAAMIFRKSRREKASVIGTREGGCIGGAPEHVGMSTKLRVKARDAHADFEQIYSFASEGFSRVGSDEEEPREEGE